MVLALLAVFCPLDRALAQDSLFLGPHADFVVDSTGRWTIEDMAGREGEARFQPADGRTAPNHGAAHGPDAAMWLRLVMPRDLSTQGGPVVLTIRETRIRTLDLFRPREGGFETRSWRPGQPDEKSGLATRYPTLTLPDDVRGETIWLRFHTPSSMRATVWVQNEASYQRTYAEEMMFFGLVFGALAALFVYFAAAAIASRDAATGALTILVLCFLCHALGDQAFIETYLVPGALTLSRVVSVGATFTIYAVAPYYAVRSLRVDAHFPRVAGVVDACALALIVLAAAAAITIAYDLTLLRRVSPAIALISVGAVLALAGATLVTEPRRALLFLLSWGPALVFGIARVVPDLLPREGFNPFLINLLYPSFACSLLLAGVAAARDVRERERALTRAAEENAARLRAFAQSASDSFFEADGAGRIVFASGPACASAGLIAGGSLTAALETSGARLRPGEPVTRAPLLRQDAMLGPRHLRLSAVPIAEGGWRGILSDVTDEIVEMEKTNQQRRMAAVGQMAGGVAHEINNLLHPMINLSRRAGESFDAGDERRRWLDIVRDSGLRAAEIVAALLSSVRPASDTGRRAPFGAALRDIAEEVRALTPVTTRFETQIETDDGPDVVVAEVFQVVANLATNAAYASRGGVVTLRYAALPLPERGGFELTMADDGVGMDAATLSRVFEPFFTTKPQGEGIGLGLSIVQALASKWGGEVRVASEVGVGTRVTLRLPAVAQTGKDGAP